ncbi:LysM peptidoglycan-binding domain-containing protein [Mesorhizobium yinganensis]|uniref:LysM peptidoglycan-binding domain-containing protein n=1 Tax=Mesorhizobium yinganensis TaxID=3157707 RepID=UPI0032B72CDB
MALTPVKVLLFLAGGTAAIGGTAYVAGVFDPQRKPAVVDTAPADQKLAALPPADAPSGPAKASSTPTDDKPAVEVPKPPSSDLPAAAAPAAPEQQAALPPAAAPSKTEAAGPAAAETNKQTTVEAPAFDLVRVEADGSIVIAGHAAPNAKVEAIIGSRVIGSAMAGPQGDFAIVLDEPLAPGDYQIVLRSIAPGNVVAMSTETAVVSIPDAPDGQVLALVEEPGKPSELITVPEPKAKPSTPPAGSGTAAAGTTSPASGDQAAAGSATDQPQAVVANQQPSSVGEKPASGGQDVAITTPGPAKASQDQLAGGPKVAVDAVEIEGRRIFVAGSADPGRVVRGYANEILLGDAKTSGAGRFLIEAERDLPVGDYIIRVDALGPDGAKVIARAAVPFEREAGENVAAVAAQGEPKPDGSQPQSSVKQSTGDKVASGTQARLGNPAPEARAGQGTDRPKAAATPVQAETAALAAGTPANIASADASSDASASAPSGIEGAQKSANAASSGASDKPAASAPDQAATQPAPSGGAETAAAQADVLSPKLQNVGGSVIIRRGDSLWRISHRVYGHGLRYSTIYLANQHQIDDPDRIYPGQVFSVPSKTEKGEEADMSTLGEQAVSPVVRQ